MAVNKIYDEVQLDVEFTQASTRENLVSKENISISFGKISKYFADLHSQAFTGYTHPTYTARTGKPTGNQTPGFGATFTISQITSDGTGHVTGATDRTVKIPNTTMGAATADAAGSIGLVPAPAAGKQTSFLRGDGTWVVPTNTNTTYTLSGAYGSSSNTWVTTLTPSSGNATTSTVPTASTSVYGITKLSSATNSTSTALAATPSAVKAAYDLANGKSTVSFSASLTSGTKVGTITIDGSATDIYCSTVNNAALTLKGAGTTVTTFTANASSTKSLDIVAGSNVTVTADTTNAKISIASSHPTITKSTDTTSTASPAHGGTFTTVDSVTRDGNGHVTKINTKTVTLPADSNTDTKVRQSQTTTTNYRPILFGAKNSTDASTLADTITDEAYTSTKMYAQPSTGLIFCTGRKINEVAIQTGSTKAAHITLQTLMTWLITTKTYIPSGQYCHVIISTTWAYANNDILQVNIDGVNYEIQLAGVIIEFIGSATSYNAGVFRLLIHSSPTINFTATSGYSKFPVSTIAEYTCNGSDYSPTWKKIWNSHPTYTSKSSGLYKITVDGTGHVSAATAVAKADITALGIPGSDTNTTYTFATGDAVGQFKVTPSGGSATNYNINGIAAGTASGTTNHLAYYNSATSITSAGNIVYSVQNSTASTPKSRTILHIFGNTVGNAASELISGTKGVLSYGDGGPQINFSTNGTVGGNQDGALIFTDQDTAAAGVSWHFVSNQTDWNVISKRFHAKTSISIGTDLPNTSYGLYVNGTTYLNGNATVNGILTAKSDMYEDAYNGALDMNNSDIYGLNSIYTANAAESAAEGIHFYRDATHVDTLWMSGGSLLFVPDRKLGTTTTAANSQKVARFTANPTTGQIVVTDGTTGGVKTTGYTTSSFLSSSTKYAGSDTVGGVANNSYYLGDSTAPSTYKLRYINSNDTTTWTTSSLAATDSIAVIRGSVTGAWTTGHIVTFNVATVGTPFQLGIHDSNELYFYKRYKTGTDTWSEWTKMNAGNADVATKLGTSDVGNGIRPIYLSGGVPVQCDTPLSGSWFKGVPQIGTDGVMEIGRYIDFHGTNTTTADYDYRLQADSTWLDLVSPTTKNTITVVSPDYSVIQFKTTKTSYTTTQPVIYAYPLATSGLAVLFQSGGNTVIGGGESASTLYTNNYDSMTTVENESLYLASDSSEIHLITDAQTYAGRKVLKILGGQLTKSGGSWISARDNAPVYSYKGGDGTSGSFFPAIFSKSKTGGWAIGTIGYNDNFYVSYTTDAHYSSDTNTSTYTIQFPHDSGTLALTSSNITGTSSNVTGTVAIAHGGTGATTRLAALRALTEEDVGTSAQYFLTITNSWGKGGYTSVAQAKTVLGLKSAAYTESTSYVQTHVGANFNVAKSGYFAVMANENSENPNSLLPTQNQWWHILSMSWNSYDSTDNSDVKNWVSQLAIPTYQNKLIGMKWRTNSAGGSALTRDDWVTVLDEKNSPAFKAITQRQLKITGGVGWYRILTLSCSTNDGQLMNDIKIFVRRQYNNGAPESFSVHIVNNYSATPPIYITHAIQASKYFTQIRVSKTSDGKYQYVEIYYNSSNQNDFVIQYNYIAPYSLATSAYGSPVYPTDNTDVSPITDSPTAMTTVNIPTNVMQANYKSDGTYWGLVSPKGEEDVWIRTSTNGLIAATAVSLANGGDSALGTSSWAFKEAYIAKVHSLKHYGWYGQKTNDTRQTTANLTCGGNGAMQLIIVSSSLTTGRPAADGYIMDFDWDNTGSYKAQLFIPNSAAYSLQWRCQTGSSDWSSAACAWRNVLDALNIGYVMSSSVIKYDSHARRFTSSKTDSAWNAQAYSNTGYADNVYVSFRPGQTTMYAMIGLDTNPSEDANYNKIDYCWYIQNNGALRVYESGTSVTITGHTTYASGDEFRVEYSCGEIRYYHNGTMCRSVARAVSEKLFFDSSFHNAGNVYDFSYGTSTHSTHTAQIITSTYKSSSYVTSLTDSVITLSDAASSFGGWICGPTKNGRIAISSYQGSDDKLYFGYGERGRTTNSYVKAMTWDGPTNTLTADKFVGALQGNVTGNCSGSSGSCTGTAANANKLNTDAGTTSIPVYFSGGVPVQCTTPNAYQTNTTTNADYRVLFSTNANDTTQSGTTRKNINLQYNPSTATLKIGEYVSGSTATKTGKLVFGNSLNVYTHTINTNTDKLSNVSLTLNSTDGIMGTDTLCYKGYEGANLASDTVPGSLADISSLSNAVSFSGYLARFSYFTVLLCIGTDVTARTTVQVSSVNGYQSYQLIWGGAPNHSGGNLSITSGLVNITESSGTITLNFGKCASYWQFSSSSSNPTKGTTPDIHVLKVYGHSIRSQGYH